MKIHELKLKQPFFDDVYYNRKEFEVRKNDRNFKKGDRLKLIEVVSENEVPTYVLKDIKYILLGGQYGIDSDYVVLGLKEAVVSSRFPALSNSTDNSFKAKLALKQLRAKSLE